MNTMEILQSLKSKEQRIKEEILVLNNTLKALQVVLSLYSKQEDGIKDTKDIDIITPISQTVPIIIQGENKGLLYEGRNPETHYEKVYAVLESLGQAKAKEVGDRLLAHYPDVFTPQRAFDVATLELSKLKKDQKINGVKIIGKNSFLYSIKKENAHDDI